MSPPGSHIKNCEGINTCEESVQVNKLEGGESRYKVSIGEPSDGSCRGGHNHNHIHTFAFCLRERSLISDQL